MARGWAIAAIALSIFPALIVESAGSRLQSGGMAPGGVGDHSGPLDCSFVVKGSGAAADASLSVAVACDGSLIFNRTINASEAVETSITPAVTLFAPHVDGLMIVRLHGAAGGIVSNSSFDAIPAVGGSPIMAPLVLDGIQGLTLRNVTFSRNGQSAAAGAMASIGANATLKRCRFEGNVATGTEPWAGAIVARGGSLAVKDCVFDGNGVAAAGGAGAIMIANGAEVEVRGSVFKGAGAQVVPGPQAGAILCEGGSQLSVIGGNFSDHMSQNGTIFASGEGKGLELEGVDFSGNFADHCGGAVRAVGIGVDAQACKFLVNNAGSCGGAIAISGGPLFCTGCAFESNVGAIGGAIFVEASSARADDSDGITINETTINQNVATLSGGAVYLDNTQGAILKTSLKGNQAGGDGGAVYSSCPHSKQLLVKGSTFKNNVAEGNGGALSLGGTYPTVEGSKFIGNKAGGQGGSFFLTEHKAPQIGTMHPNSDVIKIESTAITGSSAGASGGVLYTNHTCPVSVVKAVLHGNSAYRSGGAMHIENSKHVTISGSKFYQNVADSVFSLGGAICVERSGQVSLTGLNFTGNTATGGFGGAVSATNCSSLDFEDSIFVRNVAGVGGGVHIDTVSLQRSPQPLFEGPSIIEDTRVSVRISGCSFSENEGTISGGGLTAMNSGRLNLIFNNITKNRAAGKAGGGLQLALMSKGAVIRNCHFEGNSAIESGGALDALHMAEAWVLDSEFRNNSVSGGSGGALNLINVSSVLVHSSVVINCSSSGSGGGLFVTDSGPVQLDIATLWGNTALGGAGGGAYFAEVTQAEVTGCKVMENVAMESGGGILMASVGSVGINGSHLQFNVAQQGLGGALAVNTTAGVMLRSCGMYWNKADVAGGAMHAVGVGEVNMWNSTLEHNSVLKGPGGAAALAAVPVVVVNDTSFNENRAADLGGAIAAGKAVEAKHMVGSSVENSTRFEVYGSSFAQNTALRGGAVWVDGYQQATFEGASSFVENRVESTGGALSAIGCTSLVAGNANFTGNSAKVSGGGLEVSDVLNVTIVASTLTQNLANSGGGSTFAGCGGLSLLYCGLASNVAVDGNGGAVRATEVTSIDMVGGSVTGNKAQGLGGGICVMDSGSVSAERAAMDGNSAEFGGAVAVTRAKGLTLSSCEMTENMAVLAGGAVYGEDLGGFAAHNCMFTGCSSSTGGGAIALTTSSPVAVDSCTFVSNRAGNGTGGAISAMSGCGKSASAEVHSGWGTGCTGKEGASLEVHKSTFKRNEAVNGGAVHAADFGQYILNECSLADNVGQVFGGAISAAGCGSLRIRHSQMEGNSAATAGGALFVENGAEVQIGNGTWIGNRGQSGGAMAVKDTVTVEISNSSLTRNTADKAGGALHCSNVSVLNLVRCAATENLARAQGGALSFANSGIVNLVDGTMVSNVAEDGHGGGAAGSALDAIIVRGCVMSGNKAGTTGGAFQVVHVGALSIQASTLRNNTAMEGSGGAVGSLKTAHIHVVGCLFSSNEAQDLGGALAAEFGTLSTVENSSQDWLDALRNALNDESSVEVDGCVFENNSATGGGALHVAGYGEVAIVNGSRLLSNWVGESGGALSTSGCVQVRIDSASLIGNRAGAAGGGVQMDKVGSVYVQNSTLGENVALSGGAMDATNSKNLELDRVTFAQNQAGSGGATRASNGDSLSVAHCEYRNNSAKDSGGAFMLDGVTNVSMLGCSMSGNRADFEGGAVRITDAKMVKLSLCDFASNTANSGGAIVLSEVADVCTGECTFVGDHALDAGGAMLAEVVGSLNVTDCVLDGNVASVGGGVYAAFSGMTFTNTSMELNHADRGGALYLHRAANLTVQASTVGNNSATDTGGALQCGELTQVVVNRSTLQYNDARMEGASLMAGCGCEANILLSNFTFFDNETRRNHRGGLLGTTQRCSPQGRIVSKNNTFTAVPTAADTMGGRLLHLGWLWVVVAVGFALGLVILFPPLACIHNCFGTESLLSSDDDDELLAPLSGGGGYGQATSTLLDGFGGTRAANGSRGHRGAGGPASQISGSDPPNDEA